MIPRPACGYESVMISGAAIASYQRASVPVDAFALSFGEQIKQESARFRDAVLPPAVDGRGRRVRRTRDGCCPPECVDDHVVSGLHAANIAIVATNAQAKYCDHRNCDIRMPRLDARMDRDQVREWADAKRGRRAKLASALGITLDKVSKSLSPDNVRNFSAQEMDIVRRVVREDLGALGDGTRAIPLLSAVPAGSWREAFRNPKGSITVPDASTPPNAYALTIEGDSMDLVAADGSTAILDPDDLDLFPGRYYVARNGEGEITFKRFLSDPARLVPCSSNDAHTEILLGREPVEIVARVVGVHKKL